MSDVFATRLARTPYFVIPRLALEAMPLDWQQRFEALLVEADAAGLDTPEYTVLRTNPPSGVRGAKVVNEATGFVRLVGGHDDPWSNYRRGDAFALLRAAE